MRLVAPQVLASPSLRDAMRLLQRADVRMVLCPVPAVDTASLVAVGPLDEPWHEGSVSEVAASLRRRLEATPELHASIDAACAAFTALRPSVRISARVTVCLPPPEPLDPGEPPPDLTTYFHRDLFLVPIAHPLIRLVHVLSGPGTMWTSNDNVDEPAMARWEAHMMALHLAKAAPGPRAVRLAARALRDEAAVHRVPANTISVRKRNVMDEIVHCAPRSHDPRVVLIVDELAA